jgi:hypothetical protein
MRSVSVVYRRQYAPRFQRSLCALKQTLNETTIVRLGGLKTVTFFSGAKAPNIRSMKNPGFTPGFL